MALVPQDPVIFAASARDNIRFGRLDATDAEVEEAAARAAAAHDFITALPDGYDSYLGERGVMVSGAAETAHRHRPRDPAQFPGAAVGRGDLGAGCRKRKGGATGGR